MKEIRLDRQSDQPLYAQIRDAVRKAIENEEIPPGTQLPPVAMFAKDLGVTQTTIRRAFKDLIQLGLVGSHVGRGTFVLHKDEKNDVSTGQAGDISGLTKNNTADEASMTAVRRLRTGVGKSLESLTILARRPGLIRFNSGAPDSTVADKKILEKLAREALKQGQRPFQDYSFPLGLPELREALAARFSKSENRISPEQVLVTSGSQQAVSLLAQAALENKPRIVCETPCYIGIPSAFESMGHWVETVPRDREGPLPRRLNRFRDGYPTMLYICPTLHNPMGTDLSLERREFLVQWAVEQKALVIADEVSRDLYFNHPDTQSLYDALGPEHTVMIGSFSKSFMSGLRIGWVIGDTQFIRKLGTLKRYMDISCPPLMEGMALALLRSGEYDTHLKKAREHYRVRRDTALGALKRHMPENVKWTMPKGGFHLWVELPPGYSSIVLFLMAVERGVAFVPGPQWDMDHRFINAFRLSYGCLEINQIQEGIELLADAVKDLLKDPPSDPGLSGLGDYI